MAFGVGSRIKAKKDINGRSLARIVRKGAKGTVTALGGHLDCMVRWDSGVSSPVNYNEIQGA